MCGLVARACTSVFCQFGFPFNACGVISVFCHFGFLLLLEFNLQHGICPGGHIARVSQPNGTSGGFSLCGLVNQERFLDFPHPHPIT